MTRSRPISLGDFNFQFDSAYDQNIRKMNSILNEYRQKQFTDKPIHEKSRILDWIVSDGHQTLLYLEVKNTGISDHIIITFELDIKKLGPLKRTITSRRNDIEHEQFKLPALSPQ
ncbi:endonuclease domain of the non-LTR retrotransposon LINE-1 [Elysia marginata]|uniref:Endonuclease domain of the non-LTR retrotransposon LINE-1 n=1 Tax=Elysia marginata TaxID=1093978 RepID=A0AAV4JRC1_9GAST|nr:endonuclease domain of the non-LTR retrotransposon LINE-1 [Elysia marginata]